MPPSVNIVWGGSSAFFDRWKHQLLSRLREMVRMCQKSPLVWIALQSAVSCALTQGLGRLTAGWSRPFGNVTVNMGLR